MLLHNLQPKSRLEDTLPKVSKAALPQVPSNGYKTVGQTDVLVRALGEQAGETIGLCGVITAQGFVFMAESEREFGKCI
jgi:hypothetical protein